MTTNLFMIDLAGVDLTEGQPFDGMAFGEFIDMMGREVELSIDDADTFVTNTQAAIDATKTEGGELVGLPIDAGNHDKGDAAGWIVAVELVDKIIRFTPKWTKIGIELIGEGLRRFFSPTVNNRDKVVLGGALVNWPATTDATGKVLLRPIELSQELQSFQHFDDGAPPTKEMTGGEHDFEMVVGNGVTYAQVGTQEPLPFSVTTTSDSTTGYINVSAFDNVNSGGNEPPDNDVGDIEEEDIMTIELTQEALDELVDTRVREALENHEPDGDTVDLNQLAELMGINIDSAADGQINHYKELAELAQQQAEMKFKNQLAELQRSNRYAELAQRVTGGSPDVPRGVPVDPDTLKSELMKLNPEQAEFWGGLLSTITKAGLTEFTELGHGKQVKQLYPVPEHAERILETAVKGNPNLDFEAWFEAAGLDSPSNYDLSKYREVK